MEHWEILVRVPRASAFGLCGAIAIAAAQASSYRAPASRTDITRPRPIRIPRNHAPAKKRGGRCPLQRFESALEAQRLKSRVQMCETKRDSAPLDMRAIPKAPHHPVAGSLFRMATSPECQWPANGHLDFGLFYFLGMPLCVHVPP